MAHLVTCFHKNEDLVKAIQRTQHVKLFAEEHIVSLSIVASDDGKCFKKSSLSKEDVVNIFNEHIITSFSSFDLGQVLMNTLYQDVCFSKGSIYCKLRKGDLEYVFEVWGSEYTNTYGLVTVDIPVYVCSIEAIEANAT